MDNPQFVFEEEIDLRDKPSVRKHRTPEMDEIYRQNLYRNLFSIEEAAKPPPPVGVYGGKRLALICVSLLLLVTIVAVPTAITYSSKDAFEGDTSQEITETDDGATKQQPWSSNTTTTLTTTTVSSFVSTENEDLKTTFGSSTSINYMTTSYTTSSQDKTQGGCGAYPTSDPSETGCVSHGLPACEAHSNCQTYIPNRFLQGDSLVNLKAKFNSRKTLLTNFTCHPLSDRFVCSMFSPPCPEGQIRVVNESNYAFDIVNLPTTITQFPCSSLCHQIGESCLNLSNNQMNEAWNNLCNSMPESASSDICFKDDSTTESTREPLTPDVYCLNEGTSFTLSHQQYCRCKPGFFGSRCHINASSLSNKTISKGSFETVPEACRSVLPYNMTRGISLRDSPEDYVASWDVIAPIIKDDKTKLVFCGLLYPPYLNDLVICKKECTATKRHIEYLLASLGYPSLQCEKLPDESPDVTCLK